MVEVGPALGCAGIALQPLAKRRVECPALMESSHAVFDQLLVRAKGHIFHESSGHEIRVPGNALRVCDTPRANVVRKPGVTPCPMAVMVREGYREDTWGDQFRAPSAWRFWPSCMTRSLTA